ncbi:unnamed protein product [Aureobasidium pullulans]|nr:unnamed protein product [Aureobasidium pullulans]
MESARAGTVGSPLWCGGVYIHAHLLTGAPVRRAILQSGSLQLSPPQPEARGLALCESLETSLAQRGHNLADAPVDLILEVLAKANVASLWLQRVEELQDWDTRHSQVDEVVIGDVEYESVIWRNGIESMSTSEIISCFEPAGNQASELKALYNIMADRPTACKLGALDFINDTRFALPVLTVGNAFRESGQKVYSYVFDQVNPWQASSRAHHAVELVMLFGSLDLTHNAGAVAVREDIRRKWLDFCSGVAPWSAEHVYAFGPHGRLGEIPTSEHEGRRRISACRFLEKMDPGVYNTIFARLAAGKISLAN